MLVKSTRWAPGSGVSVKLELALIIVPNPDAGWEPKAIWMLPFCEVCGGGGAGDVKPDIEDVGDADASVVVSGTGAGAAAAGEKLC
jgi:hypothetical protein